MKTSTSEGSKIILFLLALFICGALFFIGMTKPHENPIIPVSVMPDAPKLTGKALALSRAILSDRSFEASAILKSAKNSAEVHELAKQVSQAAVEKVSYSVVTDGKRETVMFYHCYQVSLVQPIAGIVEDSL